MLTFIINTDAIKRGFFGWHFHGDVGSNPISGATIFELANFRKKEKGNCAGEVRWSEWIS